MWKRSTHWIDLLRQQELNVKIKALEKELMVKEKSLEEEYKEDNLR